MTSWNCQTPYTDFETLLNFKESTPKADNEKINQRIEQYLKREDILSSCLICGLWNGSTFLDGGCECPEPPLPEGMVY